MKQILKNKWYWYWGALGLFIIIFIWYVVVHINANDINNAILQFGAILIPLFAALIIMGQNNEQIEQATKQQLDHLQQLTDKQINTLQESTNKQIQHYADETKKVIDELVDNSILLGEILKSDLEQFMVRINERIAAAKLEKANVNAFIIGRTEEDRKRQIAAASKKLNRLLHLSDYIDKKYRRLKEEGYIFDEEIDDDAGVNEDYENR